MQSNTALCKYRKLGEMHGTAMFYEGADSEAFLTHMEARLPTHGLEAYLDGFIDGKLGKVKRKYRHLRAVSKETTWQK